MKLKDFKGIFNKSTFSVISVENKNGDYYQIDMKPEEGTFWNPGDHGIFTIPNKKFKGKKYRAFSVASVK